MDPRVDALQRAAGLDGSDAACRQPGRRAPRRAVRERARVARAARLARAPSAPIAAATRCCAPAARRRAPLARWRCCSAQRCSQPRRRRARCAAARAPMRRDALAPAAAAATQVALAPRGARRPDAAAPQRSCRHGWPAPHDTPHGPAGAGAGPAGPAVARPARRSRGACRASATAGAVDRLRAGQRWRAAAARGTDHIEARSSTRALRDARSAAPRARRARSAASHAVEPQRLLRSNSALERDSITRPNSV